MSSPHRKVPVIYALIGALVVLIFGRLALSGTGHTDDLIRYLLPLMVGGISGALIGWMRARWLTKRDQLEQQLAEVGRLDRTLTDRTRHLNAILEHTTVAIYLKDTDNKYILVNEQYEKLAQVQSEEIRGKTDFDIFPEPVASLFRAQDQEVIEKDAPINFEETIHLPDGIHSFLTSKFPLRDDNGTLYAVGGTCTDITERLEALDQLAAEREQLSVTLRSIGDGVITTDIEGHIVLFNDVACTLTGCQPHNATGQPIEDVVHLLHPEARQPCDTPVQLLLSKSTAHDTHHIIVSKNGSERHVATSGSPLRNATSEVIGTVLVLRDITERLRTQEELLKAKKLDSVGILAGGIAHDFNNILVAILGNIELAALSIGEYHEAHGLLQEAEKASLRARHLTHQLLTFAKGGSPVKETLSLFEIIDEAAAFVLRGTDVTHVHNSPSSLWLVDADEGQIAQVVQNLVINAQNAMPQGGTVSIRCTNVEGSADTPLLKSGVRYVEVVIQDHGVGIPKDILDKIFDPYFTTKQKGSGLGLAITHSIISKHGGFIFADSLLGEGTTFSIYLPASDAEAVAKASTPKTLTHGSGRVLVMDDDSTVRRLSQKMLQHLGYDVLLANDGEATLDLYRQMTDDQTPIDVVIMDLTIVGGMGGEETIKKLLTMDPKATVVVSSGYSTNPAMAHFAQYGFVASLTKPFRFKALSETVGEAIMKSRQGETQRTS